MEDIVGKKFNKLLVIKKSDKKTKDGRVYYECLCDCGRKKTILKQNIVGNHTKSCGCHSGQIPNNFEEKEDCMCIKIQDNEILIDKDDYDIIKNYKFNIDSNGYVVNWKVGKLHRYIMGEIPQGMVIDHINGNKLDNRKCNLRFATIQQNMWNSKCKGYCYDKRANKWKVYLTNNGKIINFGYFNSEKEAMQKRKQVEEKYFGNFIRVGKYGELYEQFESSESDRMEE